MDGLRVTTCYGMRTTFGLYITIYTLARVGVIITGLDSEKTDSMSTESFTPGIASSLSSYSSSPSTSLSYQTTTIEASDFSSSQELTASVFSSTSLSESAMPLVSTNPASDASNIDSSLNSHSSSPSTSLSYQTTTIEASDFSSSQELTASVFSSTSYSESVIPQVSTNPAFDASDIGSSLSYHSSSPSTSLSYQTTMIVGTDFSPSQEITASDVSSTWYSVSAIHQVSTNPEITSTPHPEPTSREWSTTPVFTSTSYSEPTTPQWSTNSVLTTTQRMESSNTESSDSMAITETATMVTIIDTSYTVQSSNKNPLETMVSSSAFSGGYGSVQVSSSSAILASSLGTLSAEHKTSTSTMGTQTISDALATATEDIDPSSTVTIPNHTTVIVSAPISSYTPDTVHTLSPTTESLEGTITVDTTSISSTSDATPETTPSYTYPTKYPNAEKATYVLQLTLELLNEKFTGEDIEKKFQDVFKNVTGFKYVRVEAWTGTSTLSLNTVFKATDLTPISKRSKGVSSSFATELYTALFQSPVINDDVKENWVSWNNSIVAVAEKLSSLCFAEDYCEIGYRCTPPEDKVCVSLCEISSCGENGVCIIIVENNAAKTVCRCETNGNVVLQQNSCDSPAALVSESDSTDHKTMAIVFGIIGAVSLIALVVMFVKIRKLSKKKDEDVFSPASRYMRDNHSFNFLNPSDNDNL